MTTAIGVDASLQHYKQNGKLNWNRSRYESTPYSFMHQIDVRKADRHSPTAACKDDDRLHHPGRQKRLPWQSTSWSPTAAQAETFALKQNSSYSKAFPQTQTLT